MSTFLDPSGGSSYGIALCARCSRKFALDDLMPDPNYPNLMVCREDADQYDPYRLAPRAPDKIVLPFVRPDTDIATSNVAAVPAPLSVSADGQRFLFVFP
jgi:hypothetical protein